MTQKGYLNVKNHGACLGIHLKLVGRSQGLCSQLGVLLILPPLKTKFFS